MTAAAIGLHVQRRAATAAQAEAALLSLQERRGLYFGVDSGIPGLHPLQATLLTQPALALHLYGDGLQVETFTAMGHALLGQPALTAWRNDAVRGRRQGALALARRFLTAFQPSPDVLLLGALPFGAHRLAFGDTAPEPLGLLYFGESLLRRDAAGNWSELRLSLDGSPSAAPAEVTGSSAIPALDPGDDHAPGGYAAMVRRALPWLVDRALTSLTLSQSYRRRVAMPAARAFAHLRAVNPAPASFFLNDGAGLHLFGASPDLQLAISSGEVQAFPVCGTVARRPGAQGEAESVRELLTEEVDAASLAVCSDALRNDLAPLCQPGSLRLQDRQRPMSLATVVHAVDRLAGTLQPQTDAWDAIAATAAPVMVTGTPRRLALEAIAQLEASPRGWYGGMVVQVASNGDALAGTILRAAAVRDGVAEVRTGGDLMADSSPEREEQESRLKTLSLWRAFGLEAAPQAVAQGLGTDGMPASVQLLDTGDAFGAAAGDCLLGLGLRLDDSAEVAVAIGPELADGPRTSGIVALGDAAYALLRREGLAVERIAPEHGRTVQCTPTQDAPWPHAMPFTAARYACYRLAGPAGPAWTTWVRDTQRQPVVLVHAQRRLACMLVRPDSLLSQPEALRCLHAALVFVAAGR